MGIIDKIMGRTKKAAGDLTGDPNLREQGRREETKGEKEEELTRSQRETERKAEEAREAERNS